MSAKQGDITDAEAPWAALPCEFIRVNSHVEREETSTWRSSYSSEAAFCKPDRRDRKRGPRAF